MATIVRPAAVTALAAVAALALACALALTAGPAAAADRPPIPPGDPVTALGRIVEFERAVRDAARGTGWLSRLRQRVYRSQAEIRTDQVIDTLEDRRDRLAARRLRAAASEASLALRSAMRAQLDDDTPDTAAAVARAEAALTAAEDALRRHLADRAERVSARRPPAPTMDDRQEALHQRQAEASVPVRLIAGRAALTPTTDYDVTLTRALAHEGWSAMIETVLAKINEVQRLRATAERVGPGRARERALAGTEQLLAQMRQYLAEKVEASNSMFGGLGEDRPGATTVDGMPLTELGALLGTAAEPRPGPDVTALPAEEYARVEAAWLRRLADRELALAELAPERADGMRANHAVLRQLAATIQPTASDEQQPPIPFEQVKAALLDAGIRPPVAEPDSGGAGPSWYEHNRGVQTALQLALRASGRAVLDDALTQSWQEAVTARETLDRNDPARLGAEQLLAGTSAIVQQVARADDDPTTHDLLVQQGLRWLPDDPAENLAPLPEPPLLLGGIRTTGP